MLNAGSSNGRTQAFEAWHVGSIPTPAGKLLKKPQAYISKIERGERGVDAIELAEFARVYNKDINYFIK